MHQHREKMHPHTQGPKTFSLQILALTLLLITQATSIPLGRPEDRLKSHDTFPIISPSIHTAMFEAPIRMAINETHPNAMHTSNLDHTMLKSPIRTIWQSITNTFNHIFHNDHDAKNSEDDDHDVHNATDTAPDAGVGPHNNTEDNATAIDPSANAIIYKGTEHAPSMNIENLTIHTTPATTQDSKENTQAHATMEPDTEGADANLLSSHALQHDGLPLSPEEQKSTWVTRWKESLSSTMNWLRTGKKTPTSSDNGDYTIVAKNETMLVARVSNRMLPLTHAHAQNDATVKDADTFSPTKVTTHGDVTTIHVTEASTNTSDEATKQAEYKITIDGHKDRPSSITLQPSHSDDAAGYDIVLKWTSAENSEQNESGTKTLGKTVTEVVENWSAHSEEDHASFLQAQLNCQRKHGSPGITRMLCTCNTIHKAHGGKRLLCISRIADKLVRMAHSVGENSLSHDIYKGAKNCRSVSTAIAQGETCLTALLHEVAGDSSTLHVAHGRGILSTEGRKHSHKLDDLLAAEDPAADQLYYEGHERKVVDGDRDDDSGGDGTSKASSKTSLVTWQLFIYAVAIAVVVFGGQKISNMVRIVVSFARRGRRMVQSIMQSLSMGRSRTGADTDKKTGRKAVSQKESHTGGNEV